MLRLAFDHKVWEKARKWHAEQLEAATRDTSGGAAEQNGMKGLLEDWRSKMREKFGHKIKARTERG